MLGSKRAMVVSAVLLALAAGTVPARAEPRFHGAEAHRLQAWSGVRTGALRPGNLYLFTAQGTFRSPGHGVVADAECVRQPDGSWAPNAYGVAGSDLLDLGLNGWAPDWQADQALDNGCSATNTYFLVVRAIDDRAVVAAVHEDDAGRRDNRGTLALGVADLQQPLDSVSASSGDVENLPYAGAGPLREVAAVDSREPTRVAMPEQVGERLVIASGTYLYGEGLADAECAAGPATDADARDVFLPRRFEGKEGTPGDVLDLEVVAGTGDTAWHPVTPGATDCDPHHVYWARVAAPWATGMAARIHEIRDGHADNAGHLQLAVSNPLPVP